MKEWNKPELLSLGVENTFNNDGVDNGDHEGDNSQNEWHWCHRLNGPCDTNHNGATHSPASIHGSVNAHHHHTEDEFDRAKWIKCCCS